MKNRSPFLYRDIPAIHKQVYRLGLSGTHGITEKELEAALEGPQNYIFFAPRGVQQLTRPLRVALARDRERYVVATGPRVGYWGRSVRSWLEWTLRVLGTDYVDLLQLHWLGTLSALSRSTISELLELKEKGRVLAIGASIHDRIRAGELAEKSVLDVLMVRYNAAHTGAERDIFPKLSVRRPAIVAYTSTAWRRLLTAPRGWTGDVPTAGHCYRFCLSNPDVDVTLTAPASSQQLEENLRALEAGPLSSEEMTWMRAFGQAVYSQRSEFVPD